MPLKRMFMPLRRMFIVYASDEDVYAFNEDISAVEIDVVAVDEDVFCHWPVRTRRYPSFEGFNFCLVSSVVKVPNLLQGKVPTLSKPTFSVAYNR